MKVEHEKDAFFINCPYLPFTSYILNSAILLTSPLLLCEWEDETSDRDAGLCSTTAINLLRPSDGQ